jgi:hypothetical protein
MDCFNRERTGPRVMLLSLVAGGVGINLTRANHMFLIDNHCMCFCPRPAPIRACCAVLCRNAPGDLTAL